MTEVVTERWHYDKYVGLVYPVNEQGERLGPPEHPAYICRGIAEGQGPLIGAAPDLLAACEAHNAVTDHWNECSANDGECCEEGYCEEGERLSARAWELTNAALAKAKGDAP